MMETEIRAVFLDRDGVLIHDVDYLSNLAEIRLYDDVPEGLQNLKNSGYKLIVVTNQSGIARGFFTETFVKKTHETLNQMLQKHNVAIDDFYYCPHHTQGKPPFNINCICRKPAVGMILKAEADHGIDCTRSFMIGDKYSDIELAVNANMNGLLITTGQGHSETAKVKERFPLTPIFSSFSAAVDHILETT